MVGICWQAMMVTVMVMVIVMVMMNLEQALDSLLAYMEPTVSTRNFTKEELLEAFCRDVDAFALELATGENSGDLLTTVEETIEEVSLDFENKPQDPIYRYTEACHFKSPDHK